MEAKFLLGTRRPIKALIVGKLKSGLTVTILQNKSKK
jgi:hypothetical protein